MKDFNNLTLLKPVIPRQLKPGRNDPCPCGSGKKYKKCCLNSSQNLLFQDNFAAIENGVRKPVETIDTVNFIHTENSDDLVVSFSFDEGTEFGVEGFMIHRCLKYEFILRPHERGPSVVWTEDDEIILVKSVKINPRQVEITTSRAPFRFDLTQVSKTEYQETLRVLKKMNVDGIYQLEIEKS